MLKKINGGRVESDSGFSIHITSLEYLVYEDNNHSISFEWNYDPNSRKTFVYVSDVKSLDDVEKNVILKNIEEALKLLEGAFEII